MPEEFPVLSLRALNRAAMARQMLMCRHTLSPAVAIERLAGMQAQAPRPPFIGLWSRLSGFDRKHLIHAIDRRDVVRGTMMRATIHLVSRRDFIAWRRAIQPVLSRAMASVLRDFARTVNVEALHGEARAFFDRRPVTFAEVRAHLSRAFPTLDERAMGYFIKMELPLIQTPSSDASWGYRASADFTVAESWLGEPLSDEGGPSELALRYFEAFGPASGKDLQAWSGLSNVHALLDQLRPRLVVFRDDNGRELFDVPDAPRPSGDEETPVRFLPEFDNLLLAYDDRRRCVADQHRPRLITKNLQVPATFLIDGVVSGIWRIERAKAAARLVLSPFGMLNRRVRQALEEEGDPLLRFVEPDAVAYECETIAEQ